MRERLAAAGSKRRQREFRCDFLALGPIVVGVTLKAARFRMLLSRSVAFLASFNSRQQKVARFRARQRLRVATHASKSFMLAVIELCMWHPLQRDARWRDGW